MGLFSFLKKNQRESTEQADQLALQTLPLVQKEILWRRISR